MTDSGLVIVRDWRNRATAEAAETHERSDILGVEDWPGMDVQRWPGWPEEWQTPLWNGFTNTSKVVSTLWSCVDLNSREMASFPIYGMRGIESVRLPEWSSNPEPSLYSDWTEAAKQMVNTFQLRGECILWVTGRYADGSVARWVVLNPDYVNIEWADGVIEYSLGQQPLDRADVCHVKYQTMPGNLRGISPVHWAARSIISAESMEALGTNLATRGGIPWGVLKTPRNLNSTEATDMQNRWVAAARDRRGAPAVLSGGIELETLTISPRDLSLIELRIFDETRIAAAFGVPPFLVGLPQPDGLTYANATALFDFHWRATLRPMAQALACAMSRWLLPRGTRLEFNRDEYVKPTFNERATGYAALFGLVDEHGNRAMTIDEIRTAERFVPNAPAEALDATIGAIT